MELKTRFWRKRRKSPTSTSDVPQTRSRTKQRKMSTSDVPPTMRTRSTVGGMLRDCKIILPKLNLDMCRSDLMTTNFPSNDRKSPRLIMIEPRLSIPRIDIAAHLNGNNRFENILIGNPTNRKEDMKHSESTSMKSTLFTDCVREDKSIVTSNTKSIQMKSLHTPKLEHNSLIIKQREISKFDVDRDDRIQQILRDVKNVEANVAPLRKHGKEDPVFLSLLRGQENIFSKKSAKVKEFVDYETPLSNRLPQKRREAANTEQCCGLKCMSAKLNIPCCQFIKKEPRETIETEKLVKCSLTEVHKNFEVQKTRIVAMRSSRLRFTRNETEIKRELSVENVENVSLPRVDESEQTFPRRKSSRNKVHVTNAKNLRSSKNTIVKFKNGSEPPSISSQSKTSVKIEEKINHNVFLNLNNGSKSQLISRQSESSLKSKKKKLNVSFKDSIDIIDEPPVESGFRKTVPVNTKTPTTSTPCAFSKILPSGRQDGSSEVPFYGFPSSVDLSPHIGLCSFVLNSVSSYLKAKSKRRMTKKEVSEKTEIVDFCRKTLKNIQRSKKFSQRLAMKRIKQDLAAKSIAVEYKCQTMPTSYVRLNRLNERDISSYKITPLREERAPLKSKTKYDYGIDDVNTDDSTDDEDDPKKIVPKWALLAKNNLKIFNPHEKIPKRKIHLWMKPPQLDHMALRRLLFNKRNKKR